MNGIRIEPGAPLLELREARKVYGSGEATVVALDGVHLRIASGEFVTLMGPSGSGKSTCLNILGCLDSLSTGTYLFRGVAVDTLSHVQLAQLRKHFFGFIFQQFNLLPRTTALENVELPLIYQRIPAIERRRRATQALADVGLEGREKHKPAELSGGQQQRVAIARALATNPEMVLADEPTGNLDSRKKGEIMRLLVELNTGRGITIVMVTHEAEMAQFASRMVMFRDGRIADDVKRTP